MISLRRTLSMVTAAVAVTGLGLVVAVAARSRPGGADEPLLDLEFRSGIDLGPLLGWALLALAVVGAVLAALGVREARPAPKRGGRSMIGVIIGLVAFVVLLRWFRPVVEGLLGQAGSGSEAVSEPGQEAASGLSGWLFSIFLAAVTAAALTRVGLSIRTGPSTLDSEQGPEVSDAEHAPPPRPRRSPLGRDPRSVILAAYAGFEEVASDAGVPRLGSETAMGHARRVRSRFDLVEEDLAGLSARYAGARYGREAPTTSDAAEAEEAASRLMDGMGR